MTTNNSSSSISNNKLDDEMLIGSTTDEKRASFTERDSEFNGSEVQGAADDASDVGYITRFRRRYRKTITLLFHIFWGMFFTSWWLSILIQDKHRGKWLIPTILWGLIMIRLISWHCKILNYIFKIISICWGYLVQIRDKYIPETLVVAGKTTKPRILAGGVVTVAVMLVGTFVPEETPDSQRADRAVSFFGIIITIFLLWVTSNNRKLIKWHTVFSGMLMQFIIALFVLRTKAGFDIFNFISMLARELLGFAKNGVAFLTNTSVSEQGMFFFTVLPSVIFFVAFVHIFFYWNVIQWFVGKFSYIFLWSMNVSGAESCVAVATPFIGIGESAILIKNLLPFVTESEIHQIMCSGFATISGSVLAAYMALGLSPELLVSSCIMSIPASLAVSKMRFPETEQSISYGRVLLPEDIDGAELEGENEKPANVLQAFANGAILGIKIAGYILTSCLCIIGMIALINALLHWFGTFWNIKDLSLELMLSYLLYPVAFLLGTPRNELLPVAKLIATKFIQNEYQGYSLLTTEAPYNEMSKRGTLIATYALCGFANFGSVGTQVGVMQQLAPNKSKYVAKYIISALITGGISTLLSTAVAAMVIHNLDNYIGK